MASPYPPYTPRSPSSNIPYAGVSTAPTYPYPPHGRNVRYESSAASLDSDSSSGHGDDDNDLNRKRGHLLQSKEAAGWERGRSPAVATTVDLRAANRTPSPTPSEAKELAKTSVIDWDAMKKRSYWLRKEWTWYYVAFLVCLVAVILFTVYHKQIVAWLRPAADWMHK
ncbi:hypothetical protein NUW54_g9598 [Trametes sanguinea]|uniref:Uncharacterized protein n=1 Tax=Trametes sanguinea TaxID=158606 RepID=A0ACC1P7E5_9APHY|nr:hypothetical protein NUW54_g9598 [Trametes sanguinea]